MNSYNNNSFNSRSYKHSRQINSNKNRRYITKKDEIGKHIMDKSTYFKTFNELSKINNKKPSHQDLIEFSNQFDCNMDNYLSEKEANKGFKYLNSKNNSLKKD